MQLDDALDKDGVILYAYAVLSNHYHLFIETPHGNVPRFMQRLNTAYSMYHRFKYSEPGHCFQGRYGAKLVAGDEYITALTRYIHLNPVKVADYADGAAQDMAHALGAYRWSSYRGYVDARSMEKRVDYSWLGLMGGVGAPGNRRRYRRYVEGFIGQEDKAFRVAMVSNRYAIGDKRFVEQVESDLRDVQVNKAVNGDIMWPKGKTLSLDDAVRLVADEFGLQPEALASRRHGVREAKRVALEMCCQYCGLSQRHVGEYFGYRGNGAVAKQRQRLREILDSDRGLRRRYKRIEKALAKV